MEEDVRVRLEAIEKKVDATFAATEKTRKYILSMLIMTIVALALPLVGLVFAIPALISTYSTLSGM